MRADGSSPAREFLDLIKVGMWDEDPEVEEVPDDEQVKDFHRLIDIMRYVATNGCPEDSGDINYLGDGLWEFRCYTKRLVFYDTDGTGGYTPKARIGSRDESDYPEMDAWFFPMMDETLRLANSWPKVSEKADPLDIAEARKIREEDLKHDQAD